MTGTIPIGLKRTQEYERRGMLAAADPTLSPEKRAAGWKLAVAARHLLKTVANLKAIAASRKTRPAD
jgi:hypothetical protein